MIRIYRPKFYLTILYSVAEQEHRIPMKNIAFKYVIPSPSFATFLSDLQTDIRRGST